MKDIYKLIASAIVGGCLGFGSSQTMLAGRVAMVAANFSLEMSHLQQADLDNKESVANLRVQEGNHMREVIDLIREVIRSNSEFVQVLKVQNELIQKELLIKKL